MKTAIASLVNRLLRHPPVTEAELRMRLEGFDGGGVRREMARRLVETKTGMSKQLLLVQWLVNLKPKNAAIRLLEAVGDSTLSMERRALAFIVLANTAGREVEQRIRSVPDSDVAHLFAAAQTWLAAAQEAATVEQPRPSRSPRAASTPRICRMKITLRGIRPPIWRRVEVSDDITLARLHDVLQEVMGWTDSHLHAFLAGDRRFGVPDPEWPDDTISEKKVLLHDLLDQGVKRFVYEYDFGDDWLHDIVIERIAEPEPNVHYPRCLAGKRACPPEDCGGPWGYQNLLHVLADPTHEEYADLHDWAGELAPEAFDLEAVNWGLSRLRPRKR